MKFTLKEIATLTESRLVGDPDYCITSFEELESAKGHDITFFARPLYDHARHDNALSKSEAGAIFIDDQTPMSPGKNYLIHPSPSMAFQIILEKLLPPSLSAFRGIHETAIIHESCRLGKDITIGPYTVIDQSVEIGDRTEIGAGCSIGPGTRIGTDGKIHPQVTIRERATIGNRVTIQPGAVIGSCGFGYQTDKRGRHTYLKHLGEVIIEDDVDIGANTAIDRARFKETRIKRGTKIDNLVQIAHGVKVGEDNLIVSQSGIAGSTETGKHVVLGGQVAVNGHIKLASGVVLAACSAVSKSLTQAGKYGGMPATPLAQHNRNSVYLRTIEKQVKRIEELEKRLEQLSQERTI
jgi:UDP-3-O-[3-hydroxymyristoyl] glucosamine N-acyltransferase